jgi:hypothetical protein
VFIPDGDVALVSGPALVAQDIDQTIKLVPGALYWDNAIGSILLLMLNDAEVGVDSVTAELERVTIADPRVNPDRVKAYQTVLGRFRLEFTPINAVKPET